MVDKQVVAAGIRRALKGYRLAVRNWCACPSLPIRRYWQGRAQHYLFYARNWARMI